MEHRLINIEALQKYYFYDFLIIHSNFLRCRAYQIAYKLVLFIWYSETHLLKSNL